MKRELGIARCGLACCLCTRKLIVTAVAQTVVQIMIFVRIKNVRLQED